MATTFWLSMGYIPSTIASDTLFDSRGWVFGVKLSDEDIADFELLRNVAMAIIIAFWLCIYGVHIVATWRIRLNRPCAAAMRPYIKLLSSVFTTYYRIKAKFHYAILLANQLAS